VSAGVSGGAGASGSATATPTNAAGSGWVTLYWGIQNEQQEVSQVQTLLANIGYLDTYRRRSYFNPQVNAQPDQSGTYGSATDDAIQEFQQDFGVNHTGEAGTCDQATYAALVQQAG
jgi:peptidoglycan hydrolase-like protein with peptidoglycan-binding domain